MPMYWNEKTLLLKAETTYGTDPTPTGAANAILATDVRLSPMEGQDVDRMLDLPFMGASGTVAAGLHAKISFKVEVKGSGAAGTPPAFGPILRACGCAEVIVASTSVTYSRVSKNHGSATIYMNIGGVQPVMPDREVRHPLKRQAAGHGLEQAIQHLVELFVGR